MKLRITSLLALGLLLMMVPSLRSEDARESSPESSDVVRAIYRVKCSKCHGTNGVPRSVAENAQDFTNPKWQATVSKEQIIETITEGKGKGKDKMQAFGTELTPDQIEALADLVRSFSGELGSPESNNPKP